ncbi:unknown [Clostridium sp. CAG:609]|nr:unknown [Clostridium sp. CAG:609]
MSCANTAWVNIFTCFTLQEIVALISCYLATRLIDNALLSSTYYRLSGDNQILLDLDDLRREKRHK